MRPILARESLTVTDRSPTCFEANDIWKKLGQGGYPAVLGQRSRAQPVQMHHVYVKRSP